LAVLKNTTAFVAAGAGRVRVRSARQCRRLGEPDAPRGMDLRLLRPSADRAERGLRPLLQGCVCNVAFVAAGAAGVRVRSARQCGRLGEPDAPRGMVLRLLRSRTRPAAAATGGARTVVFVAAGAAGVRVRSARKCRRLGEPDAPRGMDLRLLRPSADRAERGLRPLLQGNAEYNKTRADKHEGIQASQLRKVAGWKVNLATTRLCK